MIPEHAVAAMKALDGSSFQGRLLHIILAKRPKDKEPIVNPNINRNKLSSFQLKKEEERKKLAGNKEGWNSSFVRADAVVDSLAER